MADVQTETVMWDFPRALDAADVDRAATSLAGDAVWVTPDGTFRGKEQLRAYLGRLFRRAKHMRMVECGNGMMVQANRAFVEHVVAGTIGSARAEYLTLSAWELKDGKIKGIRTVYDRLSLAKQVAKGWLAKWLVDLLIGRTERGSQ